LKTLDASTSAAVPGQLTVSRRKYARYFGRHVLDRWLYRICSYFPWFARQWPGVGGRIVHWTQTKEHFEHGCLNPAIIVDSSACMVAVFTSLTAVGNKPTPVVKIMRERLDLIDRSRVFDGSKFAAASVYSRTQQSWARGVWSDFFPIIVDCLVDEPESCENATARIKPLGWQALELGLRKVPNRTRTGLFHVDVPDEMVWNAF